MPKLSLADADLIRGIGLRMRLMRENRGMSQRDVAEWLGVTYQQIQGYERGSTSPPLYALCGIAKLFKVRPCHFWGCDCDARPDTKDR